MRQEETRRMEMSQLCLNRSVPSVVILFCSVDWWDLVPSSSPPLLLSSSPSLLLSPPSQRKLYHVPETAAAHLPTHVSRFGWWQRRPVQCTAGSVEISFLVGTVGTSKVDAGPRASGTLPSYPTYSAARRPHPFSTMLLLLFPGCGVRHEAHRMWQDDCWK
ncbi:hypothetical protein BKA80DRAFT_50696 [Phyllosticta citrichinensis]